jgi:hypothetical protein
MGFPFVSTGSTRTRVICDHGSHFGGLLVINTSASAVTVAIQNSGVSKNFAGMSGSTMPIPMTLVKPSDSPWAPPVPDDGVRMDQGTFLYFGGGGISGVTAVVWWR